MMQQIGHQLLRWHDIREKDTPVSSLSFFVLFDFYVFFVKDWCCHRMYSASDSYETYVVWCKYCQHVVRTHLIQDGKLIPAQSLMYIITPSSPWEVLISFFLCNYAKITRSFICISTCCTITQYCYREGEGQELSSAQSGCIGLMIVADNWH